MGGRFGRILVQHNVDSSVGQQIWLSAWMAQVTNASWIKLAPKIFVYNWIYSMENRNRDVVDGRLTNDLISSAKHEIHSSFDRCFFLMMTQIKTVSIQPLNTALYWLNSPVDYKRCITAGEYFFSRWMETNWRLFSNQLDTKQTTDVAPDWTGLDCCSCFFLAQQTKTSVYLLETNKKRNNREAQYQNLNVHVFFLF